MIEMLVYYLVCGTIAAFIEFSVLGWSLDLGSFLAWGTWTVLISMALSPLALIYIHFEEKRSSSRSETQ